MYATDRGAAGQPGDRGSASRSGTAFGFGRQPTVDREKRFGARLDGGRCARRSRGADGCDTPAQTGCCSTENRKPSARTESSVRGRGDATRFGLPRRTDIRMHARPAPCPRPSTGQPFTVCTAPRSYQLKSCFDNGNDRTRLPVAAKIAFVTAGTTGGNAGSPTPVGALSAMFQCTSTGADCPWRSSG